MKQTVQALYDGKVLHPSEALELLPDSVVRITIEIPAEKNDKARGVFLRNLLSTKTEGPADWAENIEHYLEGEHLRDGS